MKRTPILLIGLMAVMACLSLTPSAQSSGGQENAFFTGPGTTGAMLNGAPLLPGTTVLSGETISTGPGGLVVMAPTHGSGGVLELTQNTIAQVRPGDLVSSTDELEIKSGSASILGAVTVQNPQGQIFQPSTVGTRYIVNASQAQSSMGVVAGAVTTINPGTAVNLSPQLYTAGQGLNAAVGSNGQLNVSKASLSSIPQPATVSNVTTPVSASQSQ